MSAFNVDQTRDLCSRIQVTVRVKPCPNRTSVISKVAEDSRMVKMYEESFTFDHIKWGNESQERVYKAAAFPFVEKTLQGYNATILAYGQTGTGKSYTMGSLISTTNNWQKSGLMQRCLKHIFEQNEIEVSASFVEIYDEELRDLLSMGNRVTIHKNSVIRPRLERIRSLVDGFHLIKEALKFRQECPDSLNTSRSQSHALLTLHLKFQDRGNVMESRLSLIDLAGSKTIQQAKVDGNVLGKKCYINQSFSALDGVMAALSEKNEDQILCENSLLTSILKDSLNAKSLISLVACVNSHPADYNENLRTLHFAERVKIVEIDPQINLTLANSTRNHLKATAEKSVPLSAISNNIVSQNHINAQSVKSKIKNCVVVLQKSTNKLNDIQTNTQQEYKENIPPPIHTVIHREMQQAADETFPLRWGCVEAMYSMASSSTLSINKLLFENGDDETTTSTEICSQHNEYVETHESALSRRSVGDANMQIPECYIINNKLNVTANQCQCLFLDTQLPEELFSNSQVPICQTVQEEPITDNHPPQLNRDAMGIQAKLKDEQTTFNVTQSISYAGVNRLKRLNATLKSDCSEPSTTKKSGDMSINLKCKQSENYHNSSSKIRKFDKSQRLVLQLKQPHEIFEPESLVEHQFGNIQNKRKEQTEKQMSHNEHILEILNTSSVTQLTALPQIGPKRALSIYQYRLINGKFHSFQDLADMPVWSKSTYNRFLAANNVLF